VPDNFWRG